MAIVNKTMHKFNVVHDGNTISYEIVDKAGRKMAVQGWADNSAKAFASGEYVEKDGKLYKFTTSHAAGSAWDTSEVEETNIGSELTDLKSDIGEKAGSDNLYAYNEASGAIVTVEDAVAEAVKQMRIEIAPVQDLHGYESPWIGGGGKNLFYLSSSYVTQDTVTYSPNRATGELALGGSAPSSQANRNLREISVTAGEKYFIGGTPTNGSPSTSCVRYVFRDAPSGTAIGSVTDVDSNGVIVTAPEGATILSIYSHTTTGTDPNGIVLKPFVAKSEVALPFEPYENICPISGLTGCNITRTGKNLSNPDTYVSQRLINESGGLNSNSDHTTQTDFIPVKPLTTYTLSGKNMHVRASGSSSTSNAFVIVAEYAKNQWQSNIQRTISSQSDDNSYTFTTTANTHYVRFSTGIGATDVQFELGSVATPYTEYTGNEIYSIAFPGDAGTVYGGTLTINRDGTGELSVSMKALNITSENVISSLNGGAGFYRAILSIPNDSIVSNDGNVITGKLISDKFVEIANTEGNQGGTGLTYRGNNTHTIVLSNPQANYSTKSDWQTWIDSNPFTIVYGLAEPISYSLTAPQVQLLLGMNNVFADTGSILNMVYPAEKYLTNEQAGKERINITNDTSANVMSFSDGADDVPMVLKVAVEPVQDLHGYDNPWAGGAGKNSARLISVDTVRNGITYTTQTDEAGNIISYKVNGTATGLASVPITDSFDLVSGSVLSGCPSGGAYSNKYALAAVRDSDGLTAYYDEGNGAIIGSNVSGVKLYLMVRSGFTVNNLEFRPMVRVADETPDFAPYSNICPISGWNSANVTRTGKNLFNKSTITTMSILNQTDGQPTYNPNHNVSDFIPASAGTTYVISGTGLHLRADGVTNTAGVRFVSYNSKKEKNGTAVDTTSTYVAYTTPDETAYIRVQYGAGASDVQVEEGSVPTAYEPFGTTYHIAFPSSAGTVYGGELTINRDWTGELVVDRMFCTITNFQFEYIANYAGRFRLIPSSNNIPNVTGRSAPIISSHWKGIDQNGIDSTSQWIFCASYAQIIIQMGDASYDSTAKLSAFLAEQANAGNPVTICYEVKPTTYSLTAPQVRSILGINNIWADIGKINEVQYSADTKLYVGEQQKLVDATRAMIAETDAPVATTSHAVGDVFICNNKLYKATDAITTGESIIEGSNVAETTVADELAEIKNQIANILPGTGVSF